MGDARERISGLTFKPVRNARFALGHASRSWPKEPRYLLPPAYRLPNRLVYEAMPEPVAAALFATRKAARSRQAKAAKASPFLEGVLVLPEVNGANYADQMAERLQAWRVAFETATGCKVLHISMHLDEGCIDQAGQVQRNPHAHVITDRVLPNGRMWQPDRRELADVQTLTAQALGMQRGQTYQDRKGAPARRHIPHQVYRRMKQTEAPSPVVAGIAPSGCGGADCIAVAGEFKGFAVDGQQAATVFAAGQVGHVEEAGCQFAGHVCAGPCCGNVLGWYGPCQCTVSAPHRGVSQHARAQLPMNSRSCLLASLA